jgi:hypothetical protein
MFAMRFLVLVVYGLSLHAAGTLPSQIQFQRGAVNSVTIESDTAVYGATSGTHVRQLLLTHARRDAVGLIPKGVRVVAPSVVKEA